MVEEGAMRRTIGIVIVSMAVFAGISCKQRSEKYSDVRDYLKKSIAIQEEYLREIENAKSAKDVAAAMNAFAEKLKAINPIMKALMEKYPEIVSEKNIPAELNDIMEEQNRLAGKIHDTSMKNVAPFTNSPEVVEATKNLSSAMGDY